MSLNQQCITDYTAFFACKINDLSDKYESALDTGSECSENLLFQLQVAIALNTILCSIDLTNEECLDEEQICQLIDNLQYILKNPCNC